MTTLSSNVQSFLTHVKNVAVTNDVEFVMLPTNNLYVFRVYYLVNGDGSTRRLTLTFSEEEVNGTCPTCGHAIIDAGLEAAQLETVTKRYNIAYNAMLRSLTSACSIVKPPVTAVSKDTYETLKGA